MKQLSNKLIKNFQVTVFNLQRIFKCLKIKKIDSLFENCKIAKLKINRRPLVISLIVILAFSSLISLYFVIRAPSAKAAWYTTGGTWNYRQKITINHTKVPNTDQANFPVLVKITDAGNAIFTAKAQDDGDDIIFVASDETTKLSYEIERFDKATPELVAWVKIPTLSFETDTIIYMYYGNSSATGPTAAEKQAVWSNGYAGVWHSNNASTTTIADSTSNGNTGNKLAVDEPVEADGKLGKAQSYNGSNSIDSGSSASLDIVNEITIEAWVKETTRTATSKVSSRRVDATYYFLGSTNGKPYLGISGTTLTSDTTMPQNELHHLVVTFIDATNIGNIYYDGQLDKGGAVNTSIGDLTGRKLRIGAEYDAAANFFIGTIDEARVSSTARTADWIATEYANQNDPATFFSLEAEVAGDLVAPSNPTDVDGYSASDKVTPITSGNFYTAATPYFEWTGAGDTGNTYVSGVAGYYSYFGTSCGAGGANPTLTRGVLSDTGGGLHYSVDANATVPDLTTNNGTYCLRIKTIDNAGNTQGTIWEAFIYGYDVSNPDPPAFIAVNPAGYSSIDSFDFSWPVPADNGGSGIQGYQYKRGNGEGWSATIVPAAIAGITSYQTGENIFIVRSVDNAENYSAEVQTTYYYSADPPGPPTALLADPLISDTNSFEFSWTAPVHARPIIDYGYVINAVPTALNLTWTGDNATTLAADAFATQQGVNTLYLVAKDDSGAYDITAFAQEDFNCTTVAPPIPTTVSITDSSDQALARYMLTIQWVAGVGQGASFNHYSIERSTDGVIFAEIATTASTAYIDASGLDNTTTYYYQIKSVDNALSSSAASSIVSKIPTGKYTTAPTIVTNPTVVALNTSATITWAVNRPSTAAIRYGTDQTQLTSSQISSTVETDHTLIITGLEPGATYYYQVQSLDALRSYTLESAYSAILNFETLSAPVIANVAVSNITLTTADVTWETTSASNTKVHYGTTISYGTILPEDDTSMTTRHSVKLTDLIHTTKYHFKIEGEDINFNLLSSDDYTFNTLSMPVISNIEFTSDFTGATPAVTVKWLTTGTPTSSMVSYKVYGASATKEENQSDLVEEHSVTVTGLENNITYEFVLSGTDQYGNSVTSDAQIFKTTPDARAPQITKITVESSNVGSGNINEASVTISWTTDEPATSQVAYDLGLSNLDYKLKTPPDTNLTQNHMVIISGLVPQTPYHFKVMSKDETGNTVESDAQIVISGQVNESVLNLVTKTLTNIFGWIGKMW